MAEETFRHTPVMPDEVLRLLRPERGGVFLDATIGGAGHAIRLLETGSAVRVIGIDQDAEAIEAARRRLAPLGERVRLIRANFRDVGRPELAGELDGVAGALMDLGVSSHQIDTKARGFSFRPGTPLGMRMDETRRERSAADLLNRADEQELGRVFRDGEERRWRVLSREVVRRRKIRPFSMSDDLVAALSAVLGRPVQEKRKARLFQALRIAVNDELAALGEGLEGIRGRLAPGGRLAVLQRVVRGMSLPAGSAGVPVSGRVAGAGADAPAVAAHGGGGGPEPPGAERASESVGEAAGGWVTEGEAPGWFGDGPCSGGPLRASRFWRWPPLS